MRARAGLPRRRHLVEHFEDPALAARDDKRRAWPDGTGIAYPRGTGRIGGCAKVNAMVRMRVDDGGLKVVGVQGLRIADASVFPRSPGSFIVSAVVQVGEAAAIKAIAAARALAAASTTGTQHPEPAATRHPA